MRHLILSLLVLAPGLACAQPAGRLLLTVGDVVVARGSQEIRGNVGTEVQVADTIRVGPRSNVQVRMSDESIIALRSNSVFRIDEYIYSPRAEESRSVFSLVKGGLRTVSGAIGRAPAAAPVPVAARAEAPADQKKAEPPAGESKLFGLIKAPLRTVAGALTPTRHAVKTPTATIGIRGTHYTVVHCDNDCAEPGGGLAPAGSYGAVTDGRIVLVNNTGEREFGAHEFFHVASADSEPRGLIAPPGFLYDRLEAQERNRGRTSTETSETMAQSGLNAESRPSETPLPPTPESFIVTEQRNEAGTLVTVPPGLILAGGIAFSPPDIADMQDSVSATLTLDDTGRLLEAFSATNSFGDTVTAARGTASHADTGGDAVVGVFWGRWTSGATADVTLAGGQRTSNAVPGTGIHWIFGNPTVPTTLAAATGTVSYAYKGGTNPTDQTGTTGTMNALGSSFNVDFTNRSVSGTLVYDFPNNRYSIPVSAPLLFQSTKVVFSDVQSGSGTCSICQDGSIDLSSVGGTFYGFSGEGLGVTFATDDSTAGQTAGAALFGAQSTPLTATRVLASASLPNTAPSTGFVAAFNHSVPSGVGAPMAFLSGSELTTSGTGPSQILTAFDIPAANNVFPADGGVSGTTTSAVSDTGSSNALNAYWGRWLGGTVVDANGTTTVAPDLHYLVGPLTPPDVIAAKTGSATFTMIGGTQPTNNLGAVATFAGTTDITVDFTARTVGLPALAIDFPGQNWRFGGDTPALNVDAARGAYFNSKVTGSCGPITGCSDTAAILVRNGVFMGPVGDHLGVAFQARTTTGTPASFQTTKIFSCAPNC